MKKCMEFKNNNQGASCYWDGTRQIMFNTYHFFNLQLGVPYLLQRPHWLQLMFTWLLGYRLLSWTCLFFIYTMTKMSFLLLQKCFCIKNIQLGMHAPTVVVVVMSDWLAVRHYSAWAEPSAIYIHHVYEGSKAYNNLFIDFDKIIFMIKMILSYPM